MERALRRISLHDLEEDCERDNDACAAHLSDDGAGAPTHSVDEQRGRFSRRRSRSFRPSSTDPLPAQQPRRFSQSFSCFTTGVVKRQRRVSTECHSSLVIADPEVLASLRESDLTASTCFADIFEEEEPDDREFGMIFDD